MPLTPHMQPCNSIVLKRVTARQTDVKTRRYCIECSCATSKLLRVTRKILRPQGPWALQAQARVPVGRRGARAPLKKVILERACFELESDAFYAELTSSHFVFLRTLCLPCMQPMGCRTMAVLVLRISITHRRHCAT